MKVNSHLKGGALTYLNLMFVPSRYTGDVTVLFGPPEHRAANPEGGLLVFPILSGQPTVSGTQLDTGDTVFFSELKAVFWLGPHEAALEIHLTYLNQSEAIKLSIAER